MTEPAGTSKPTEPPSGERARPTPTIELAATEIDAGEGTPKPGDHKAGANSDRKQPAGDTPSARSRRPSFPPPQGKASGRVWPVLIAGIIGACIAMVAGGLWLSRMNLRGDGAAALAPQVAAIQSELRDLMARPQFSPEEMQRTAELSKRLVALEDKLQAFADAANRGAAGEQTSGQISELLSRISAAEQALRPLDDVAARLGKLEGGSAAAAIDPGLGERLKATEAALKSLDMRVIEFTRRLDAIDARLADTTRQAKATEERSVENQANAGIDQAARLAVLADALTLKVERGQPFAAELSAIKPFVSDPSLLGPLAPLAETGVPTAASAVRELSELIPSINSAIAATSPEDSLLNRLQTTAQRFVRVRPIDAAAGDDPRSVLARLETEAAQNDVDGAMAEIAKLPAQARDVAKNWTRRAQARRAAIEASRRISASSVNALGKPPSQ